MTIPKEAQAREDMTLRELCQALDISRRTVQGYEAQGLVSASKKTNMGYLIYDSDAQQRVRRIRQYQRYGFKIKEIAILLDASEKMLKSKLEKRLINLRKENCQLQQTIAELEAELISLRQKKRRKNNGID